MSQRREFVEDALRQLYPMRELCARYGISRRVGYKWLARYREQGLARLEDQSRRPHRSPTRLEGKLATLLLEVRQRYPTWGARKLLAYLERRHRRFDWPTPSTVAALLKREGLVVPRRRRRVLGHPGRPLTPMDHRKWFRLRPSVALRLTKHLRLTRSRMKSPPRQRTASRLDGVRFAAELGR